MILEAWFRSDGMTVSYNAVCNMEVPERSQSSKAPKGDSGFKLNVIKLITEVTMPTKDVNFMKSAASIKRRLLASNKFVDQLMATVKTKRARLHRLREETLASRKRQEDRDIAMAALALALEKGGEDLC